MMTIKTNEINATTIKEAITEIQQKYGLTGDQAEAAASHIIYADTDWHSDVADEQTGTVIEIL